MSQRGRDVRPVKRAISFVVHRDGAADRILIVRRPDDDEDLPGVWGLPAGSLRHGEGWEDAVRRAGREKLGVALEVGPMLREGTTERSGYTLHMRLFQASIAHGEPRVPQPPGRHPEVTRYQEMRWGTAEDLRPAADMGSLCSRLLLETDSGA